MKEIFTDETCEAIFPPTPQTQEERETYYRNAVEKIESAASMWLQRDFDSEEERSLDFYANKKRIGYLTQNLNDMTCEVFVRQSDDDYDPRIVLVSDNVTLLEAVSTLQNAATSQQPLRPKGLFYGPRGH